MKLRNLGPGGRTAGVTLIELVVAVAIVGILAAVAFPSYAQYIIRTHRSAAKSMIVQIADRQEQFFADNKRYADDLTDLGYPTDGFMIDDQGTVVDESSNDRIYAISLSGVTATAFTANAVPQLRQAAKDTECGTFTLNQAGVRATSGSGDNCW